jgi:hypothetical protein
MPQKAKNPTCCEICGEPFEKYLSDEGQPQVNMLIDLTDKRRVHPRCMEHERIWKRVTALEGSLKELVDRKEIQP